LKVQRRGKRVIDKYSYSCPAKCRNTIPAAEDLKTPRIISKCLVGVM
jgi:hypothetical protein